MSPISRTVLAAVLVAASVPAVAAGRVPLRRFAVIAGANDGGPGRAALRYAGSDAETFARVLRQLGGTRAGDAVVLVEPHRADFLRAIEGLERAVAAARADTDRIELVVYYSGHSDDAGLLLGSERVGYSELRQALERTRADVRVAILDSCASGALLRQKGGKWLPPFALDASGAVKGHAFLTATSADEAAQESDRIGSSFFTYALVTGLRGAADANRDGKVTLHEAYQFAFDETLQRTEHTRGGPQHPAYEIQLAGTGDLVLTDLRGSSAVLVLAPALEGRLYLRDASRRLVAELHKVRGRPLELGLEPGTYGVTLDTGARLLEGDVALVDGQRVELSPARLSAVVREPVASRGGVEATYREQTFTASLVPSVTTAASDERVLSHINLNLVGGRLARLSGVELGIGLNWETERMSGFQLSVGANLVQGEAAGVQLSSGANWVSGAMQGVQLADIVNHSDRLAGAQLAAVNLAGDARGAQLGWIANHAKSVDGVQLATVNVAGEARGTQLGIVNVARRSTVPVGLVNVAEDADAPIGLVNVVRHGYHAVALYGTDVTTANVAVKMGGRYLYTLLGMGLRTARNARYAVSGGFGGHVRGQRLFLDVELVSTGFFDRDFGLEHARVLGTLRAVGGLRVASGLAVVAGPALNVLTAWDGNDLDLAILPEHVERRSGVNVHVFPGFLVGMQGGF